MRVLVSGAGIAGLALGVSLSRKGHDVVICERSPSLRTAGYMIDFFGPGYQAAERLGLIPDLEAIHQPVKWLMFAGGDGRPKVSLPYPLLRKRLFEGRHFNFMRGDLERVLYDCARQRAAIVFGAQIDSLEQAGAKVLARLSNGWLDDVDLVIGADGVRSHVRRLAFGPAHQYVRPLGYNTAAFVCSQLRPTEDATDSLITLTTPGRQVGVYRTREGLLASFFIHVRPPTDSDYSLGAARRQLEEVYGGLGWVVPQLLREAGRASDIYFDCVAQVVMPAWSKGRVALVGDAAYCVSLVAGQGASLALAGAYLLAEAIEACGRDVERALTEYEARLRPLVERKQAAARSMARWFVPESRLKIAVRDLAMRVSVWPVASAVVRGQLAADGLPDPA